MKEKFFTYKYTYAIIISTYMLIEAYALKENHL